MSGAVIRSSISRSFDERAERKCVVSRWQVLQTKQTYIDSARRASHTICGCGSAGALVFALLPLPSRLVCVSPQARVLGNLTGGALHNGHPGCVREREPPWTWHPLPTNHSSIHCAWKTCAHGSVQSSSPSQYSTRHTAQLSNSGSVLLVPPDSILLSVLSVPLPVTRCNLRGRA